MYISDIRYQVAFIRLLARAKNPARSRSGPSGLTPLNVFIARIMNIELFYRSGLVAVLIFLRGQLGSPSRILAPEAINVSYRKSLDTEATGMVSPTCWNGLSGSPIPPQRESSNLVRSRGL